jgi:hypothetical protein
MTISTEALSLLIPVSAIVLGAFVKVGTSVLKELRQIKEQLITLNTNKEVQAIKLEDMKVKVDDHEGRIRTIEGRRRPHIET